MKKGDVLLIALVAAPSLLPLPLLLPNTDASQARVTVAQRGVVLYEGPLSTDATVATPDGGNVVEIRDGRAYMKSADCPDGLCLHGTAQPGMPLVCLPNGVTVTITGDEEAESYDGITY